MGKAGRERLEDLRENDVETREENKHLKEKVQMFNRGMAKMEKHFETSTKIFPLLMKKF